MDAQAPENEWIVEFTCIDCGEKYPANLPRWRCDCGGPLEVAPNAVFTRESLAKRPATLWRYREAIPIEADENIVSMNEGMNAQKRWHHLQGFSQLAGVVVDVKFIDRVWTKEKR